MKITLNLPEVGSREDATGCLTLSLPHCTVRCEDTGPKNIIDVVKESRTFLVAEVRVGCELVRSHWCAPSWNILFEIGPLHVFDQAAR